MKTYLLKKPSTGIYVFIICKFILAFLAFSFYVSMIIVNCSEKVVE